MPRGKRGRRRGSSAASASGALASQLAGIHANLLAERADLDSKLAAIESTLSAFGGATAPRRGRPPGSGKKRGRPPGRPAGAKRGGGRGGRRREGSLKEYIGKVLATGGVMRVKDIADAVVKSGYQTTNKTLAKSVGIALTQMKDGVRRVGRGRFRVK